MPSIVEKSGIEQYSESVDFMPNSFHFQVRSGTLKLRWNARGLLARIEWDSSTPPDPQPDLPPAPVLELIELLRGFFAYGEPIGEVPWNLVDRSEWTVFREQVYRAIARIPHGETRTYGWVAERIGKPGASRAIGQALRVNPLPLLIPCHRVVARGSIGGFMGHSDPSDAELRLKRELLGLEEAYLNPVFSFLGAFDSAARVHPLMPAARSIVSRAEAG
jgi:methylated-DNA-[protein]-cysteine S-methyltransferase